MSRKLISKTEKKKASKTKKTTLAPKIAASLKKLTRHPAKETRKTAGAIKGLKPTLRNPGVTKRTKNDKRKNPKRDFKEFPTIQEERTQEATFPFETTESNKLE